MALAAIYVFLMIEENKAFTKLVDITGSPAFRNAPEMVDVSDMSHDSHLYIFGLKDTNDRAFTANYSPEDYQKLIALEGQKHTFAVWLGGTPDGQGSATPTGAYGKHTFDGCLSVSLNEFNAGEAVQMTITIATQSEDTFSVPTNP